MPFQPSFRPLSIKDAEILIRLLRREVMRRLGVEVQGEGDPALMVKLGSMNTGIFVSIEKIVLSDGMFKRMLRGSMGTLRPMKGLIADAVTAVVHASFYDPRFSPISASEFKNCVMELTLVSEPLDVDVNWVLNSMVLGYHGLQLGTPNRTMIILPQRIIELAEAYRERTGSPMGRREFVKELCGRRIDCSSTPMSAFETQIIYELRPEGEVIERKLYLNRSLIND
jgi:hypothetical protein